MLYKGFVETKNKKSVEKFKNRTDFKSREEVQSLPEYAGILAENVILVDLDDPDQAEILMNIVDDMQLNCKVIDTTRGKHFLFYNTEIDTCATHANLAIGLRADIKVGFKASYEVLKVDGKERFVEWDTETGIDYQQIPKFLYPVKHRMDFLTMDAGDGRNQALFNYILTLQSNGFSIDETRQCIRIINKYVLKDPLDDEEIETILRDEAFEKPVFFNKKVFLFDKFSQYLVNVAHVVKINNQLHVFDGQVYRIGYHAIEKKMIELIPNLKDSQRKETLKYLELTAPEIKTTDANYIAFKNGVYDLRTDCLEEFSPDYVLTNMIPHNYNPEANSKLADHTLDKLACKDPEIRDLLEECIGYCFYRRNEMRKAFVLVGGKRNGKSTYLDCIKAMLGEENIAALDLQELGDRFSTAMMFGKLANIGDDIGDDFLQGNQVAMFKKIVAGNRIKAERKGQDPFEFNPYIKLLFSANDIPRMKDKTGAVLDRLIIIPFNATFSKQDPDYNPYIKYDLIQPESIEYLIKVGIQGLKRVLEDNREFTTSNKVEEQIESYEEENNPIIGFLKECDLEVDILNEPTAAVYKRYTVYCMDNQMKPMTNIAFTKQVNSRLGLQSAQANVNGKNRRIFKEI